MNSTQKRHYTKLSKRFLTVFLIIFALSLHMYPTNQAPYTDTFNGGRGVSFNNDWKFYRGNISGAEQLSFNDADWRKLDIPHDWSIELPFYKNSPATKDGGYLNGGIGWYRKTFTLPEELGNKRITMQFEGIYMNSTVWINGKRVGNRPYGYSTFEYDITPYINKNSEKNVIAIKVENIQPTSRWYSGSGIYRNVWITATDPVHIAYCGSYIVTPVVTETKATLQASTEIKNDGNKTKNISVITTIYNHENELIKTNSSNTFSIEPGQDTLFLYKENFETPNLWSPKNPYLYKIKTQIVESGNVLDYFRTNFGFRAIHIDANTGLSVNGEKTKLYGVCMHHDLGSLGAAQNYRALERQVEILKSFGCNAIRTSHNPPAHTLLEICDRMGILVMDEIFDCWKISKRVNDYGKYFDQWAEKDIEDWVKRDRNNPSVIMWSIGNEITEQDRYAGKQIAQNLMKWIKNSDKTRLIAQGLNQPNVLADIVDIVGYNYASGDLYDRDRNNNPDRIILGSETSSAVRTRGVYHLPANTNRLTTPDMQCSNYDNSIVTWGHSAENAWLFDSTRPYVMGQFVWTGFDYIGEPTPYGWPAKSSYFGIVDMCGFPKDIYYFYQSIWTDKPMVHLLPHWNWSKGENIPVWAYSNCDSVKITVNGKIQPTAQKPKTKPYHAEWIIPFEDGKIVAYAYNNHQIVAKDSIVTATRGTNIELIADRTTIDADGKDLVFIETNIRDKNYTLVPNASHLITYEVSGQGKLVGVDNGNPLSIESFKGSRRKAFNGKSLAIVQSNGEEGDITVTATTPPQPNNIALKKTIWADSEDKYIKTNIALRKTATASTFQPDNPITSGNDGNLASRWCASDGNTGHWWMVDLGEIKSVTGTEIHWEMKDRLYKYKIEASTNKQDWEIVADRTENTTIGEVINDNFNKNARYIKVTITALPERTWASFFEFRVYDGTTTLSEQQKVASNANDGNLNTYWRAADDEQGHSLTIDLGNNFNVNKTQIDWENNIKPYKYTIETSTDNDNWKTVKNQTANTNSSKTIIDNFPTSVARYVRITITGGTDNNNAAISEFQIFDGSEVIIPPATVTLSSKKPDCEKCQTDKATIFPWVKINNNKWIQTNKAEVKEGDRVIMSVLPNDTTQWVCNGPNNYTANSYRIIIDKITDLEKGKYTIKKEDKEVVFNVLVYKTSVKNTNANTAPFLFPNPSNGIFSIKNNSNCSAITIYGMEGKAIYQTEISTNKQFIDLSFLQKGVYVAEITLNNKQAPQKQTIIIEK